MSGKRISMSVSRPGFCRLSVHDDGVTGAWFRLGSSVASSLPATKRDGAPFQATTNAVMSLPMAGWQGSFPDRDVIEEHHEGDASWESPSEARTAPSMQICIQPSQGHDLRPCGPSRASQGYAQSRFPLRASDGGTNHSIAKE